MKKIFSLLIILSAFVITANAQTNSDGSLQNKKGMKHGKKLIKDLDLSKQQKKNLNKFANLQNKKKKQ